MYLLKRLHNDLQTTDTDTDRDFNLQHALVQQMQAAVDSSTQNAVQSATPSHPTQDIQRKTNKLTRHFQACPTPPAMV